MVYCPNCGTANQEGSHFCSECGERLPGTGLRCPMCGAVNRVGDVLCGACSARLVPVSSALDDEADEEQARSPRAPSSPTTPSDETQEVAKGALKGATAEDWLSDLRDSVDEEAFSSWPADVAERDNRPFSENDVEPLEPVDIPDWLQHVGPRVEEPQPSPDAAAFSPPEPPEGDATSGESPPEEPPLDAADVPDWLLEIAPMDIEKGPAQVTGTSGETLPEEPPLDAAEVPDWLLEIGPTDAETVAAQPTGTSGETPPEEPPLGAAEVPDWLLGIAPTDAETVAGQPTGTSGETPPEEPPLGAAEVADWLLGIAPADAETVAGQATGTSEESLPEEPVPEAAEIPDWLLELAPAEIEPGARQADGVEHEGFLASPESPDWLRDLETFEQVASAPSTDELPAIEESEEPPGWAEPDGAMPAGLEEATSPPAQDETSVELPEAGPDEVVSPTIVIPDWLKESLETGLPRAPQEPAPEQGFFPTEQIPHMGAEAAEEGLPEAAPESFEGPSPPEGREEAMEEAGPLEVPSPVADELPEELEMPAWLIELLAEPPVVAEEVAPSPAGTVFDEGELAAGIDGAEIPEWLEDLRPSEAKRREVAWGAVETEGLLKGLRGLLPASPAIAAPSRYEGLSAAMTSQASLARAELLQILLSQPVTRPEPRPRKGQVSRADLIERWLVFGVLLLAVLVMLFAPRGLRQVLGSVEPVPTAGALQLYAVVGELGAADHVLVALEYGPTEADELNAVSRPILEHLTERGAHISVVSTRPDGPLVASALMSEIADTPDQYTLLSYRPGAAAAASHLLTAVDPSPALLLVLTSQGAPLRRWVEQARAHFGDQLPVILAGSAALEPAASPYLEAGAGQLRGSIHGFTGAASYEALRGAPGGATQRVDALAVGHVAIVALMCAGAVYYGLKKALEERA